MGRRFFFWQNINSMHQSAFLNALSEGCEVTLVTTEADTGRAYMGWDEPELPNVRVLRFDETDWRGLIGGHRGVDDWHVFAGLQAFRKVHAAFVHAMSLDCRVGLYAEPLRMDGVAGFVKMLRGSLDGLRFGERVGFVLCIGREARSQFRLWGFPEHKLSAWAYVTEMFEPSDLSRSEASVVRGIFPASLIHRKGADILMEALESFGPGSRLTVDAYSVSEARSTRWQRRLMERAEAGGVLRIHPYIDNRSLVREISRSDFTVLPSRFDGWGAVVNESLSVGTPVIVSRSCGASELLEDRPWLGSVLDDVRPASVAAAVDDVLLSGPVGADQRRRICEWARGHITGAHLRDHFLAIVGKAENGGAETLTPPWQRESFIQAANTMQT